MKQGGLDRINERSIARMSRQQSHGQFLPIAAELWRYCHSRDWSGRDPYDALNSPIFKAIPLLDSRIPRIALTQLIKRSPIDVGKVLRIPISQNAKALSLFLRASLLLPQLTPEGAETTKYLRSRLEELRSPGVADWSWGYNFPWQTRTVLVPTAYPNLVCTTFVAMAFLDLFDCHHNTGDLEIATNSAEFILRDLYWTDGGEVASFSYPLPELQSKTHNANLLAAALLCRVYTHTGDKRMLEAAIKVTRFSAGKQRPDGGWLYGEASTQNWIDNFHTGYNLTALRTISQHARTDEFLDHIERGFAFYRNHFICEDGAPKYFHDRTYPIDVHCVAQSIITLTEAGDADLASKVAHWAIQNMWDEAGYFYYQVRRSYKIRIPYMRWGQAWMLLALCTLCSE